MPKSARRSGFGFGFGGMHPNLFATRLIYPALEDTNQPRLGDVISLASGTRHIPQMAPKSFAPVGNRVPRLDS